MQYEFVNESKNIVYVGFWKDKGGIFVYEYVEAPPGKYLVTPSIIIPYSETNEWYIFSKHFEKLGNFTYKSKSSGYCSPGIRCEEPYNETVWIWRDAHEFNILDDF